MHLYLLIGRLKQLDCHIFLSVPSIGCLHGRQDCYERNDPTSELDQTMANGSILKITNKSLLFHAIKYIAAIDLNHWHHSGVAGK
jgi:hypothetical protein